MRDWCENCRRPLRYSNPGQKFCRCRPPAWEREPSADLPVTVAGLTLANAFLIGLAALVGAVLVVGSLIRGCVFGW